ncbi:unnamed protein product [Acanthoscelides obtectus]|uniref:BED-type domain-containing protein n=1 Tax=Acanthoscelides obtectus TaxID=200917 RepID=A0A9P0PYG3_ACAOB|nr:unnamed protein product [Acanthoscelides obtectus]CAK1654769.1 hypothetical protein AOBTE_LOCUS18830 [Acanthoscelides obtectus]
MVPTKSNLWIFFSKKGVNLVVCKTCLKEIKTSGNTTNMAKHLKLHKHLKKDGDSNINRTPKASSSKTTSSDPEKEATDTPTAPSNELKIQSSSSNQRLDSEAIEISSSEASFFVAQYTGHLKPFNLIKRVEAKMPKC